MKFGNDNKIWTPIVADMHRKWHDSWHN